MKILRGIFYLFLIFIAVLVVSSFFAPQSVLAGWVKA
jgi:hypothetical protein